MSPKAECTHNHIFETRPDHQPDPVIGLRVRWVDPGQPKKIYISTNLQEQKQSLQQKQKQLICRSKSKSKSKSKSRTNEQ
jgi:hypothetical protein